MMAKKRKNISIGVLIVAVVINAIIYLAISTADLGKINEFSEKYFGVKIIETDALAKVDNNNQNILGKTKTESEILDSKYDLYVHFIDVGQGDAILIEQDGHNMLIDAGPTGSKKTLEEYLQKNNVKNLDYIIVTHNHEDHIGGMANIISNFNVGKILMSKDVSTTKTYENLINAAKSKNLKFTNISKNETYEFSKSQFIILSDGNNTHSNINNHSIVIKLKYGDVSFLFMGDAEKEIEEERLSSNSDLKSNVIKLGHHGSNTSSSKEFILKVDPDSAIVSCRKK